MSISLQATATITCTGGEKIILSADTSGNDYFVFQVGNAAVKLSNQDLKDLRMIVQQISGARMSVS